MVKQRASWLTNEAEWPSPSVPHAHAYRFPNSTYQTMLRGHEDDASRTQDIEGGSQDRSGSARAAYQDRVEAASMRGPKILDAAGEHPHTRQSQLTNRRRKERYTVPTDLDQAHVQIRPHDRDRYPGNAGARADIRNHSRLPGKVFKESKTIDDDVFNHPRNVGRADEAMHFLPFNQ